MAKGIHLPKVGSKKIQNLDLSVIYKYTSSENEMGAFLK